MRKSFAVCLAGLVLCAPALAAPNGLDRYAGHYQLSADTVLDIAPDRDGQLLVKRNGRPLFAVYPDGDDVFSARIVPAKLRFSAGDNGIVNDVAVDQGGSVRHAKRVDDAEAARISKRANSAGVFRGGMAPGPLGSLGAIN